MSSDVSCKEWTLWKDLKIALPGERQPSLDQLSAHSLSSPCLGHASMRERDRIRFNAILGECHLIAELNFEPTCSCIVADDEAGVRHVDQRSLLAVGNLHQPAEVDRVSAGRFLGRGRPERERPVSVTAKLISHAVAKATR